MATDKDKRRHGVIEVHRDRHNAQAYWLTIGGRVWSEVEWSSSRRRWCIQDAAGRCLAHVEHIHAQDADLQTALALARRMIRDGRMPTPEEAAEALRQRQARPAAGPARTEEGLGELIVGDLVKPRVLEAERLGEPIDGDVVKVRVRDD
jgi:hypothetical protein